MKRKDDGDYAIRKLDGTEFGYKRRKLKVEWSQVRRQQRRPVLCVVGAMLQS